MNTKIKLLLTVVFVVGTVFFAFPNIIKAQETGSEQGMMANDASVAIKGFCPVCVLKGMKVRGSDHFVTEYQGKIYKFAGFDQQKMFIEDPQKYIADLDDKFNALGDDGMMKKDNNTLIEGSH